MELGQMYFKILIKLQSLLMSLHFSCISKFFHRALQGDLYLYVAG